MWCMPNVESNFENRGYIESNVILIVVTFIFVAVKRSFVFLLRWDKNQCII